MIEKVKWSFVIKDTNFHNFYNIFIKLDSLTRFKFHKCQDTVLQHTFRMLHIHTNLLAGQFNDLEYFAILFHDFEEIFTGDIPTPIKSLENKEDEKKLLIEIYKQIQSLNDYEFLILKKNLKKVFQIGQKEETIKNHIKVIDTFDAMMFSFMQLINNRISFLAPFLFYISPHKEKSFVNYLTKIELKDSKYAFFNYKTYLTRIYGNNYYLNLYTEIIHMSFSQEDINLILEFEKNQISKKIEERDITYQLQSIKEQLNINEFDMKLHNLIKIFSKNKQYKEWNRVFKYSKFNPQEFKNSLIHLKDNEL
ncbi:MAG: HD domain-containing protein [Nanoarchaeota archaeon]|nr:HD domain-containing protein [Nanoarchaeota archaeon]